MGIGQTVKNVINHNSFLSDPRKVIKIASDWEKIHFVLTQSLGFARSLGKNRKIQCCQWCYDANCNPWSSIFLGSFQGDSEYDSYLWGEFNQSDWSEIRSESLFVCLLLESFKSMNENITYHT
jgi:hypothetical protein